MFVFGFFIMVFKKCFIPCCLNTSENSDKLFISVPFGSIRKKWFASFNKYKVPASSQLCCCEDHFDFEQDAHNWSAYKDYSPTTIFLYEDVVPHKYLNAPKRESQLPNKSKKRKLESPAVIESPAKKFSFDPTPSTSNQEFAEEDVNLDEIIIISDSSESDEDELSSDNFETTEIADFERSPNLRRIPIISDIKEIEINVHEVDNFEYHMIEDSDEEITIKPEQIIYTNEIEREEESDDEEINESHSSSDQESITGTIRSEDEEEITIEPEQITYINEIEIIEENDIEEMKYVEINDTHDSMDQDFITSTIEPEFGSEDEEEITIKHEQIIHTITEIKEEIDIEPMTYETMIYNCIKCGFSTTFASTFHVHVDMCDITNELKNNDIYTEEMKPFECKVCGKSFDQPHHVRNHMRSHVGLQQFKCRICAKLFMKRDDVLTHLTIHTGDNPLECNFCNKTFTASNYYQIHIRTHTRELYTCHICNKIFKTSFNLNSHMRIHPEEKLFECKYCPEKFFRTKDFLAHWKAH